MTPAILWTLFKRVAIVLVLCIIALTFIWMKSTGEIMLDRKRETLIAAQDPGSYLIPATCLFFRGTEGQDFVRGPERYPGPELCWYTRGGFRRSYPELWLPVESFAVKRQVLRMGINVFRAEQAGAPFHKAIELSIRIGGIGLMGIICLVLLAWQSSRRAPGGTDDEGWRWRLRND